MVNFQTLIEKLNRRGWSHARIAEKVGCSRPAIYRLADATNSEPRYHLGAALVDLERRTRPRK